MNLSDASILIVDDEPILLAIFAKWLGSIGCRGVLTAPDGRVALDLLARESIDLLLSDVHMPNMDGITLVRCLAETGRQVPSIVFVSGLGDVDQREMYALGVEAFIAKPFDRRELLSALQSAVADRSTLWHREMATAPRQSLSIEAQRMEETASPHTIGLGRGGVTVCCAEPVAPGKIAFRFILADPAIEIFGQGYVRWRSRTDCKAGIEFAFLDPAGRAAVTRRIDAASPRSFIPRS